jgi:hypothetical protein
LEAEEGEKEIKDMKKALVAMLIFIACLALYYIGATLRCKSLAKGAASRIGYSFREGCYIKLSGENAPLK